MADTPATFGGPGWAARKQSHREDIRSGEVWRRVGVENEWGPLTDVLISMPSEDFGHPGDPEAQLMLSWPSLAGLRQECEEVRSFFESVGVTVHLHAPPVPPPLNYLFMRDLVLMTPAGAIVARPASPVRAGEARVVAEALAELGIPIIGTPTGEATLEGADALWLDAQTLILGTGNRTNQAGLRWLSARMEEIGVSVLDVPVPAGAQHLLGIMVPLSKDRVIVDAERTSPALDRMLSNRGLDRIDVDATEENRVGRGMNVVVLGPDQLVMPAGCPELVTQFRSSGVEVHEVAVPSYVQAAGALGCLTAIIRRECTDTR
jgi:N-dimethylarginine dimethylaminohydrolase